MLLNTIKVVDLAPYRALDLVASFATVLSTYFKGFTVLIEPCPPETSQPNPVIQLFCHDAALCMQPLFKRFKNVLLTGSQLQPIDSLPKVLGFNPRVRSF